MAGERDVVAVIEMRTGVYYCWVVNGKANRELS